METAMMKAVLCGTLVLCLAACGGESARDVTSLDARRSDGARAEESLVRGTRVSASIQTALSSRTNRPGESVHAIVSVDVKGEHGGVVIPSGSDVTLTVAQLESGSDAGVPEGRFALAVTSLTVYGKTYPMKATLDVVPRHLESIAVAGEAVRRDVVVSAGTPIELTLAKSLNVPAK
jgi:hypothetical protein